MTTTICRPEEQQSSRRKSRLYRPFAATPARITATIEDWASTDLDAQQLTYIRITPSPWAFPLRCHGNVDIALQMFGGRLAIGWTIYETKGLWLSAELHSVWEHNGELLDITPDHDPTLARRLFADSGRRIEHGGEEWKSLVEELTDVSINGNGGRAKLLSTSSTVKEILEAHRRIDKTFTIELNRALVEGRKVAASRYEAYWGAKDRLSARLEGWLSARQRPDRKALRAKKKGDRKRRKLARKRSS